MLGIQSGLLLIKLAPAAFLLNADLAEGDNSLSEVSPALIWFKGSGIAFWWMPRFMKRCSQHRGREKHPRSSPSVLPGDLGADASPLQIDLFKKSGCSHL